MLSQDEDRIKTQITEVESIIEREVEDFERQHTRETGEGTDQVPFKGGGDSKGTSKETVGEPRFESLSVSNAAVDTTNLSVQASRSDQAMAENQGLEEHNGEVVVEAEEDTVIY